MMMKYGFQLLLLLLLGTLSTEAEMKKESVKKGSVTLPYQWTHTGDGDSPAMILFLHGAGERGDNNQSQTKHGVPDLLQWLKENEKDCVVIAPQCPREGWWANSRGDFRDAKNLSLRANASPVMKLVFSAVDQLVKSENVDPKRIYITGLSMGGYGTFDALARRPDFFAAAVPICGGGDVKTAEKFKHVPLWIFHGDADNVVPVTMSQVMVKALKEAGGEPKYTEYPGVKHNSWTQTYRNPEVWLWLFAQQKK